MVRYQNGLLCFRIKALKHNNPGMYLTINTIVSKLEHKLFHNNGDHIFRQSFLITMRPKS